MRAERILPVTFRLVMLLLVVVLLGGCAERTQDGEVAKYGFTWGAVLGSFFGGIAATIVGLLVRRRVARLGWMMLIMGPLLAVVMAPGFLLDYVRVDRQGFDARYGFWFSPRVFHIKFADLSKIRWVQTVTRTRRGGARTEVDLYCLHRDGNEERVHVGDLMKHAVDELLDQAQAAGVPVTHSP